MNMINNIFSIFDPSTSRYSIIWPIILISFIPLMNKILLIKHKIKTLIYTVNQQINKEINQLLEKRKKISPDIIRKVFIFIIVCNLIAIIPFNFTRTAHISISFSIRLRLWVSVVVFGWTNHFKKIIVHLTPTGTPNSLINFMVLIEIVRIIIRPITLSIRLSANIVAGHLLISLLSNFSIRNKTYIILSYPIIIALTTLELIVAIVQAYVFITLVTLYQNENIA